LGPRVYFDDEDVLSYDTGSSTWSMVFDGLDVDLSDSGVSGRDEDLLGL
jgi:hypothetical protein